MLDEKLISISGNELSESSGLSVEAVNSILSSVRDEIVDLVVNKKSNVSLNLGFGILHILSSGTVEFKPVTNNLIDMPDTDKLPETNEMNLEETKTKKTYSIKRKT
jgi:hypothetical protein